MDNAKANNMAIAGLVLGIVSVVFAFLPNIIFYILGLILGIIGIVVSVKGRKSKDKKGMATAGLVLSIIGTVLAGIVFVCALCVVGTIGAAGAANGIDWSQISTSGMILF